MYSLCIYVLFANISALLTTSFYMKSTILKLILTLNLMTATPSFASVGLQIAQERISSNGVLVSRPVKADLTIAQVIGQNRIRTVEDYAAWLASNMTYQRDAGDDQWLDPVEFLKTKRGDCEDFAILNLNVLRLLGYKAHIITLNSSQNAHAVCAFEYSGKFYWFDNAKLKTSSAATLTAFAQEITDQLHYTRSYELDPLSKHTNLIYTRI